MNQQFSIYTSNSQRNIGNYQELCFWPRGKYSMPSINSVLFRLLAQVPHSLAAECSNSKFTSRFLTMSVRVRVGFGAEQVVHCTVYWQQGQLKEQQWNNTIKAFSHRMRFALCSPPGGAHTPRPSWTFFNLGTRVQKHTRHPRAVLSLAQTGSLSHPAHTYTINGSDGASLRFARSVWNRLKVVGWTAKKWATLFT